MRITYLHFRGSITMPTPDPYAEIAVELRELLRRIHDLATAARDLNERVPYLLSGRNFQPVNLPANGGWDDGEANPGEYPLQRNIDAGVDI
jgi:hypothetical protein